MSDRIKEWDEYFGIHCHLPAAAIRDLFEGVERLRAALERHKTLIALNCDPCDATEEDAEIIAECYKWWCEHEEALQESK